MQFSLLRPILRALCRDHCQSLINNDEKVSSSKQKPNSRQKCKNLSLFMTKTAKAIPFWASQYSPYERFTPPALKFSRPKKYLGRGGMGTLGFEWWVFKTQAACPSSQCDELALSFFFFFYCYADVKRDIYGPHILLHNRQIWLRETWLNE